MGETSFENAERELFVVSPESGGESARLFNDGCFDFIEPVRAIGRSDSCENSLTLGFDRGREIAHSSGWCHARHVSIVSRATPSRRFRRAHSLTH